MTPSARLVPFDIGHISLMDLDGKKVDEIFTYPEGIKNLESAVDGGDAFTMIYEGRIMGCGGIVRVWDGVGQAWVIPSAYAATHPLPFARMVRRMLDSMMRSMKYHRVQAIVATDLQPGQRWIEMLGFTFEGLLVKYGPNKTDYRMYARVT